jgi:hypothetical protein
LLETVRERVQSFWSVLGDQEQFSCPDAGAPVPWLTASSPGQRKPTTLIA